MTSISRGFALASLVALAFARHARAQISTEWSKYYVLPEAYDGDCYADAVAVLPNGQMYVSTHVYGSSATRFLKLGSGGGILWSTLCPPSSTGVFPVAATDSAGNAYFVGLGTPSTAPVRIASYSSTGTLRWLDTLLVQMAYGSRVHGRVDASDRLIVVADDQAGSAKTALRGDSSAGAVLFDYRIDLVPGAVEIPTDMELAPNSDVVVTVNSASSAVAAALTYAGSVAWSASTSGSHLLGAEYSALDVDASGAVVAAGTSKVPGNSTDVLVSLFDASGQLAWSLEQDVAGGSEFVKDVEFASDGAIWVLGRTAPYGYSPDAFAMRIPRSGGAPESVTWAGGGTYPDVMELLPGEAAEMWAISPVFPSSGYPSDRLAFVQLVRDASVGINLRWKYSTGSEGKYPFAIVAAPAQRVVVVGRTDAYTGPYFFFDPIAWIAQFDLSDSPDGFCTAKINSLGCTPEMSFHGLPSLSAADVFEVDVAQVLNQRTGLFFYGLHGQASVPFQGGIKCVQSPVLRTPTSSSGGSAPPALDCSGVFALDWNAFATGALGGAPAPELLVPGTEVNLQCWSRDAAAASGTSLSSALRYVVLP